MTPLVALLAAAGLAAFGLGWLILTITRAEAEKLAEGWARIADVQRNIDDAWQVIGEQRLASDAEWLAPVPRQLYNQVEVEWLYETFALPAADVWEDGQECPRRRQDGER